ncbi:MAG: hypothetical protein ABI457_09600 [Hyphomicrobium sp.]
MPIQDTIAVKRHTAPAPYRRDRDLPALLPLWPHEMQIANLAEHARLLARMRRALRVERQRGIAGHWTYDLARHSRLLCAYRAETIAYLQRLREPAALAAPT